MVNTVMENKVLGNAAEQEIDLINILIHSSLYQDMYPEEKEKLLKLSYIVIF